MKFKNLIISSSILIAHTPNLGAQNAITSDSTNKWRFSLHQGRGKHFFPQEQEGTSVRSLITPKGIESVALLSKTNPIFFGAYVFGGNAGNTICKYNTSAYDTEFLMGKRKFDMVIGFHHRSFNAFYYTSNPNYPNYSEHNTIRSLSFGLQKKWIKQISPQDDFYTFVGLSAEVALQHTRQDNVEGLLSTYNYAFLSKSVKPFNLAVDAGIGVSEATRFSLKYLLLNPFNQSFVDGLGSRPFSNRRGGKFFFQADTKIGIPQLSSAAIAQSYKNSIEANRRFNGEHPFLFGLYFVPFIFPVSIVSESQNKSTASYPVKLPTGVVNLSTTVHDPLVTPIVLQKLWKNVGISFDLSSGETANRLRFAFEHSDLSQAMIGASTDNQSLTVQNTAYSWCTIFDFQTPYVAFGVKYAHIYKFNQAQFVGDADFSKYAQIIPTTYNPDNFIFRLKYPFAINGNALILNYMPNYLKSEIPFYNKSLIWVSIEWCPVPIVVIGN
jgi:hypothetical protein